MGKNNSGGSNSLNQNQHYRFHVSCYLALQKSPKKMTSLDKFLESTEVKNHFNKTQKALFNYNYASQKYHTPAMFDLSGAIAGVRSFRLVTRYPGLLIGIGDAHGTGTKGEIALGFSLDYVTGRPIIPGSSVKGCLRAAFSLKDGQVIQAMLQKLCSNDFGDIWQHLDVSALAQDIFGDPIKQKSDQNDDPYGRDVFFDAVAVCKEGSTQMLGQDFITPHRNTDALELAEPTPLMLLKILPDVPLRFSFLLRNSELKGKDGSALGTLLPKHKETLFRAILCAFGIGAKTNVGYGILTKPKGEAADGQKKSKQ